MSEDKKYLVSVSVEATVALEVKAESLYYAKKKAEKLVQEHLWDGEPIFPKDLNATLMRNVYFAGGGEEIEGNEHE